MIEDNISETYEHKNPLIRWYFKLKMKKVIKIAAPNKEELILDFGCGSGKLKQMLPGYKIIGYDINPKQTKIRDYSILKPNKIISVDVFEHIPKESILEIIDNFKKMNPKFKLIVSIPTESFISRKIRRLLGKRERALGHITPLKEILKIFRNKGLRRVSKLNLFNVSYIALYENV